MLDKSIPFYRVMMKREKGSPLKEFKLPDGFVFSLFSSGDEKEWAEIETSVGEFDTKEDALEYFQKNYLPYLNELERRCIFIEDDKGKKIGTLTIWWRNIGVKRDPWIQWVAIRPEYQGLGLGKAIIFEGMKRLIEIEGDKDVYLNTQTWSYKAINIYRKAGFNIIDGRELAAFKNDEYDKAMEILKNYIKL